MNIQEFAFRNGFPVATVCGLARSLALEKEAENKRFGRKSSWPATTKGVSISRSKTGNRFRYWVIDEHVFLGFVIEATGLGRLPELHARRLADAARVLYQAAIGDAQGYKLYWRGQPPDVNQPVWIDLRKTLAAIAPRVSDGRSSRGT